MHTIKQLADLAGISVRTLHYYDEIGLLKASSYGENSYRYYDEHAVLRLQQILFFRELDFSLDDIRALIDSADFDMLNTLQTHKLVLQQRVTRLNNLMHTLDQTILHLEGQREMTQHDLFAGFTNEQQKQYEQQIRERYGKDAFKDVKDWKRYTKAEQAQIKAEGNAVYRDMAAMLDADPASPAVQALVERWHRHLRYFYEPSIARMRGLADLYNDDPEFQQTFTRLHADLAPFLRSAINHYCDGLEATSK